MDGLRLRVSIDLRWADTDQYGHINNVAFVRYAEEARIRAFSLPDLLDDDGDREYLIARVTLVIMDVSTRRPRALTGEESARLRRYLGPGVRFR